MTQIANVICKSEFAMVTAGVKMFLLDNSCFPRLVPLCSAVTATDLINAGINNERIDVRTLFALLPTRPPHPSRGKERSNLQNAPRDINQFGHHHA